MKNPGMRFALLLLWALPACQKGTVQQLETSSAGQKSDSPPGLVDEPVPLPSSGRLGVKNFSQLFRSMAAVTGVPPTSSEVQGTYDAVRSQLPQSNDLASLQSSHQSAIVKLAAQFCDRLFETADLRAQLLPELNFAAAPALVFTAEAKSVIASRLMDRFWGEAAEGADRAAETSQLTALTDQLLAGAAANGAGTRSVLKGLCTAVLSSAPFILL